MAGLCQYPLRAAPTSTHDQPLLTPADAPTISSLRNDPRIQKIPPFLSLFCILVGIAWLLLLPLDSYSRYTYISENALLPGQVHTYFTGSEQNVFRAYKHEVDSVAEKGFEEVVDKLAEVFGSAGLRTARQKYEYSSSGQTTAGENIYSVLHAPRGDATEAIVLAAPWNNTNGEINRSGVALLLTLARYFKRWSLWSKDIIFLVTSDSWAGPQAWVDAYHDTHSSSSVSSLPLKSGALQGVVVIDYPFSHRFDSIHIVYDGVNGQLPNLDLVNTAAAIAGNQMGIGVSIQQMWKHDNGYRDRLRTMLRGMFSQGLGHASGPHSSFIPYHVDAITLQAVGEGWQDEMAMGRTIESIFRSLNNLLEKFHQSFFFYLLMHPNRFVSIGTYLPSAMLIAGNFTIMAIALWIQSGRPSPSSDAKTGASRQLTEKGPAELVRRGDDVAVVLLSSMAVAERKMLLPLATVIIIHFLGLLPLYIFNHVSANNMEGAFHLFAFSTILPAIASWILYRFFKPTPQQYTLIKCFSVLLLGMFLSTLATLNFSLAFLVGLLASPLSFIPAPHPTDSTNHDAKQGNQGSEAKRLIIFLSWIAWQLLSPQALLYFWCKYTGTSAADILVRAAFGWHVWRMWIPVVIWCVWWPASLIGSILLWTSIIRYPNA